MKNKRYLTLIALLLSFSLFLVSCGGEEEPAPVEEAVSESEPEAEMEEEPVEEVMEDEEEAPAEAMMADGEKATIEIWINSNASCMVETVVDTFNAQSDSIHVEAVVTENPWDATRTAMAGGAGPDIVRSPGPSFVFELVQAKQLLPMDEMSAVHGWADSFAPFALSLGSVEGKLYSLPDEMETLVLYYNKTVFEENGWTAPTTVAEMHALAAEINDAGIIPFGHGNTEWRPANEWFVGEYLNHVAGPDKVYQALTDQIAWTDPAFVEAIELLDEAQQEGWYMGGLEFYYTTTFDDLHTALATGEAAMNIEGTWAASSLNDTFFIPEITDDDWDWVAFPSTTGDAIFDLGMGNTSSINANTEHPAEAAEFLNYWFSAEVQADRFSTCGIAPAPVVIPEGTITGMDDRIAGIFESLSAAAAGGDYGYTTWTFFPPKTDVYIYEEIEKVWAGDITATDYLAGMDALFQEEFDAGEIPPIPDRDGASAMEAAPADAAAAPVMADGEKATIEIWINSNASCVVETVVDTFNAQSNSIIVEAVVTEQPWDATRTAMAGGAGPDIVRSPGPSFVFELVQAGQLLPMDEMSAIHAWADSFAPFALSLGSVEGKLYSLPDEMETLVLYYNKTVFEDNGWTAPTTVAEMHALAAEINDAGIIPFGHGNTEWRPANEWFVGEYLNHVAGPDKVYQALTDQIAWTDPAFVEAIELLDEAQQEGWYMGGLEFYYTTTFDDLHTALATGEAAMNIEGTWAAAALNDTFFIPEITDNDWDWVAFPSTTGEAIFDLGMGNTSSINANTEHPAEAAEFLNYWFSAEVQADRFSTCGIAPAPVVIPEGTITGMDDRIAGIFESLSASAAGGDYGYTTWTFFPPKTDVYIYEEIEKVWSGDITATEYLEGMDTLFQEEFDAGEIPPIPER